MIALGINGFDLVLGRLVGDDRKPEKFLHVGFSLSLFFKHVNELRNSRRAAFDFFFHSPIISQSIRKLIIFLIVFRD